MNYTPSFEFLFKIITQMTCENKEEMLCFLFLAKWENMKWTNRNI